MDYEGFMQICKEACHERQACQPGYEQLLRSKNVNDILATMSYNWYDVWGSKFADIVADRIAECFKGLEKEFHEEGFFVNEDAHCGRVIVTDTDKELCYYGHARVYVFGKAHVKAFGESQVFSRHAGSEIELYDNAYAKITAGRVWAHDHSSVESHQECWCYNATSVLVSEGVLHDIGHRRLTIGSSKDIKIIKGE